MVFAGKRVCLGGVSSLQESASWGPVSQWVYSMTCIRSGPLEAGLSGIGLWWLVCCTRQAALTPSCAGANAAQLSMVDFRAVHIQPPARTCRVVHRSVTSASERAAAPFYDILPGKRGGDCMYSACLPT